MENSRLARRGTAHPSSHPNRLRFNMEEPSPEFIAATSVAQLAPLLFRAAEDVDKLGSTPEHVAVAAETAEAYLAGQDLDVDRSVATVQRIDDGVKIEYKDRTVTIKYDIDE